MRGNKKKGTLLSNLKYIMGYAWSQDKVLFAQCGVYTILASIAPFIGIFLPKFLIDELLGQRRIEIILMTLIGFFLLSSVVNYSIAWLRCAYSPRVTKIRTDYITMISDKIMKMDFKNTEDPEVLNKIKSVMNAVMSNNTGVEGVYHTLLGLFGRLTAFVGYISIVLFLSPWILLFLIINVLISYALTMRVKKYEYSQKEKAADKDRRTFYVFDTMYDFAYGKDIRIYDLKNILIDKFKKFRGERIDISNDVQEKQLKVKIVDVILLVIRECVVYGYLIYNVLFTGMGIGDFTMYFSTINGFGDWMKGILDDLANIKAQNMYLDDMREFLEIKSENKEKTRDIPIDSSYEIEFKNVSFKYPKTDKYIYKNLSLKIKKGQRLAIVGINGAGKTTFVKLLCRLYEPTSGEILINGVNIKDFSKEEYYKILSVVFQDIKTFAFTVAENVSLENLEDVDREKVLHCIEKAGVGDKINSLKKGIDTSLLKILDGEGIELSGGENQKLALARALYKNGKIVILDEPTSALDAVAEYNIYKGFDELIGDKTAIYISHRLASTKFCDVIAFFENGEIVEYGTHEELLKKNGKYSDMFNIQAQYYKEESGALA
ncbi:ABC transporter ATP-binding protein [Clostridium perfringens]|uniref:ABC transporter ATP-binding protein n=1 Tax=Clostridium perfringens TaxID=1502 RepID=UPI0022471300|nr:ABC transporter ATP-binding protein [Clostridium perfringens]MCX0357064.1 ABC transporter ATP-binding protein/permease [Clostridium perfringens]MCX0383244.1 ABC transporter ATP-binding protein/permease [Clostridium perfringens]MCX0406576.1 ABC transporter ATP-binding protein/permease [Clostridium perfringens]MCX0419408.1 ABC transporter ATP-binding protein/permease [Clostridium perfringens]WEV13976.1 ABC transporter ATP-binding protein [Clostridium perfringens D]